MQCSLPRLSAIALGLTLAWPAAGQQAAPQEDTAPSAGAPLAPAPGGEAPADASPAPAEGEAEPEAPPASAEPAADAPEAAPMTDTPEGAPLPDAAADVPAAEAPDAPEAAPDAPAAAGAPPEVPAPMAGQPEQEQVVIRESFGDWDVRCAEGSDECALHQLGLDEDDNPVLEFSLFRVPEAGEAAALVNILSPLGTFLPGGITMQVDAGQGRQYGFTFCTAIGCVAQIALTDETVAAMRRGRTATLSLASIAAPEEPVEIELSLMGFTDAFNSLARAE